MTFVHQTRATTNWDRACAHVSYDAKLFESSVSERAQPVYDLCVAPHIIDSTCACRDPRQSQTEMSRSKV